MLELLLELLTTWNESYCPASDDGGRVDDSIKKLAHSIIIKTCPLCEKESTEEYEKIVREILNNQTYREELVKIATSINLPTFEHTTEQIEENILWVRPSLTSKVLALKKEYKV